ncbi:MAG: Holliday junction branch migration protein RuvA [Bacilli bacterium]|jgi:Holliday junction DNA helicase RuvA|nr:Holliday junction branch migration protein RuvA [Bacilli bacterium]
MIYGLKGTVVETLKDSIVVDVHDVLYELLVSRPSAWKAGGEASIYAYEVYGEDEHYLVGFVSALERQAFLSLVQVKGIGPKTALAALRATTPEDLYKAIAANNTTYLKKLPGIGPKAAAQIILDLKGQLTETDEKGNPAQFDEVRQALKRLGFRLKEIDEALASVNEPNLTNEEVLRLALRHLRKEGK